MAKWFRQLACPQGSTGNVTFPSIEVPPDVDQDAFILSFIVEAVGATPTVTYKWQYSLDDPSISDANATWFDLLYHLPGVTPEVAPVATTRARTAVSTDPLLPTQGAAKKELYRRVRLVTSANTNVTFRGEVIGLDSSQ